MSLSEEVKLFLFFFVKITLKTFVIILLLCIRKLLQQNLEFIDQRSKVRGESGSFVSALLLSVLQSTFFFLF